MSVRKNLTSAEVQEILKLYPHVKACYIAAQFNVSIRTIYGTAKRYGVKKSDEFRNSPDSGRIQKGQCLSPETKFKKGHEGPTKGRKIESIIKNKQKLAHWREKCLWKKGHKPYNTGKDGEIRWRENLGYYFIRMSENNWEFLHRNIWEKSNGKIPAGYNVVFKDGNRRNCVLENLECISNAELGERNRVTKYPQELKNLIITKNKLINEIKKYEKSNRN